MSRVGKQIIKLPAGVEIKVSPEMIVCQGPKGVNKIPLVKRVTINIANQEATVAVDDPTDKFQLSLWGTYASLLKNAVIGVTVGYQKQLEINGVGFKAAMNGGKLLLNIGFSHPVEYLPPTGIEISTEKNVITIKGINKELVGQVAAKIRAMKKPEPYKGKGIKYSDEVVRRKAGKVAKGGEK